MNTRILITAALFGLSAVGLGAWAAHGLSNLIEIEKVNSFKTGVQYQFAHAFLLLFLSLVPNQKWNNHFKTSYFLVVLGVVCFSGSIYILALKDIIGLSSINKIIWPVTPLGGLTLMAAWLFLIFAALKHKKNG